MPVRNPIIFYDTESTQFDKNSIRKSGCIVYVVFDSDIEAYKYHDKFHPKWKSVHYDFTGHLTNPKELNAYRGLSSWIIPTVENGNGTRKRKKRRRRR